MASVSAEALFLMQRYWGSDDEEPLKVFKQTENVSADPEPLRKKRKRESTDYLQGKNDVENNTLKKKEIEKIYLESSNSSELLETKILTDIEKSSEKKHKKPKKKLNGENEIQPSIDEFGSNPRDLSGNFCKIGQIKNKKIEKTQRTLPEWLNNPAFISRDLQDEKSLISDITYLDAVTKKNLVKAGIQYLFPVQLAVIPWLMQCNQQSLYIRPSDLCVSAPTGSGKTLAFVLPIVQCLKERIVCAIRAVIVLPVSELAIQVYKVFETFVEGTDLKVILLTGHKSFLAEQNALVKKGIRGFRSLVDIVVTTPGRILDHIHRTKGFCLKSLRYLVIDEADRMMDDIQQGWLKQVEDSVYKEGLSPLCVCFDFSNKRMSTPSSTSCGFGYIMQPMQKLLYSATLSHDPEKLHTLSLYKPKLFTAALPSEVENGWIGKCPIPDGLHMCEIICEDAAKPMVLCHIIKQKAFKKVLCFTETAERAQSLHLILAEMGLLQVREISSYNRPIQRKIVLEHFVSGKVNILVCSDLVARGIDIEDIDCVVSYDVPTFVKTYIHRIGRTARAGKKGTAITLLSEVEIACFRKMLKTAEIPAPEREHVDTQDLTTYIPLYKKALKIADAKIKKFKIFKHQNFKGKKKVKRKNKLQQSTKWQHS
ncbi:ATP-dependent RNA helicase DDX51, partial [Stegodyphus mimosarum]